MFTSRFFASSSAGKLLAAVCLIAFPLAIGCGGSNPDCSGVPALSVGPATAMISHTAAPPANSQMFSAILLNQTKTQNGCVASQTAVLVNSNWMASDPSVQLSTSPTTQVTATCTAALTNPVTITATQASGGTLTAQAMLTCN